MTKKEQLLYLRDQAKKSGDVNLKKLVALGAQSGKQSPENQKKIWAKVEQVVKKFKDAEQAAEKAQKASVAKKVAAKPKSKQKSSAKKAKSSPASKPKKKSGRGPKSRGETFFGRAKMIREDNPSLTWKEAQAEAKKFFADEKSRKAKAVQDAIKSFPNLKKATKDTTNIRKDAAQPAMPPGKRKSRPGAKRKFYWESRSNRSDLRQPSKKYPMLEKGGKIVAPSPRYLNQYMMATNLDDVDQAMRALEMTLNQGRTHAQIAKDLGFADKLNKGGSLNTVLVKFDDPKYNYRTSVSARTTEESARQYFIGLPVNVGSYPNEVFKRVVDIEFNPPGEKMQKGGFVSESEMQSAFRQKDLSTAMGMDVDEDGFPEDLDVSLDLRKKMRDDEKFAQKVREAIMETSTMSSIDVKEAARIFRELGIDMDYDLGGEPLGMSLMRRGGRFQKGGKVYFVGKVFVLSPRGTRTPNLIQRVDDKVWFMRTKPRPYGRISCQPLVGYQQGLTNQEFLDEWFAPMGAIDSAEAVDWQWMSSDSILIEKLKREKVTDFESEMMSVKSRKLTSANDSAIVRSGLLEMGVPEQFAEEATEIIMQGRNLEKGGKVSRSQKLAKKKIAEGLKDVEQALSGASKKHKAQSQQVKEMKALLDDQFEKGGKTSKFDKLSKKVAKSYEGKKVPKRFQSEYGKTYDAEEAREVGDKVAAKVYRLQQKKK